MKNIVVSDSTYNKLLGVKGELLSQKLYKQANSFDKIINFLIEDYYFYGRGS